MEYKDVDLLEVQMIVREASEKNRICWTCSHSRPIRIDQPSNGANRNESTN